MVVVEEKPIGWWKVQTDKADETTGPPSKGWAPATYVKPLPAVAKADVEPKPTTPVAAKQDDDDKDNKDWGVEGRKVGSGSNGNTNVT